MMKFSKRIIAGLLAFAMVMNLPIAAFAQTAPKKTEVVYAKMHEDGTVTDVQIVNGFEKIAGDLVDYGAYDEVLNLTNADPIEKAGDRIDIKTAEAPFYYQGKLRDAQLPWNIAIQYTLDGKSMKADELIGKTGKMGMELAVTKNKKADDTFSKHYLLQIMVNLDSNRFEGIEAEGATIASQGETKLVTYTVMPDQEATFKIQADGKEIELGMIQIAGMPFSMEFDIPDLSEYTGDLVQLQDAIAELSSGVDDFTDGVSSVYDGSGKLKSGAGELSSAARNLSSGLSKFTSGMNEYQRGLAQYVEALEQGVGSMASSIPTFDTGGLQALENGSAQLADGIQKLDGAMRQNLGSQGEFAKGLDAITAGATELSNGMNAMVKGANGQPGLVDASSQIQQALKQMSDGLSGGMPDIDMGGMSQLGGGLNALAQGLQQYLDALDAALGSADAAGMESILTGLYTLQGTLGAVISNLRNPVIDGVDLTGITPETNPQAYALLQYMAGQAGALEAQQWSIGDAIQALEGSAQLIGGMAQIRSATAEMLAGIQSAQGQLSSFDPSAMMGQMMPLITGIQTLSEQYNTFHTGLSQGLTGIQAGLDNASAEKPGLVQGLKGLQSGYKSLATGLLAGSGALVPGGTQLAAGIKEMTGMLGSLAKDLDFEDELKQLTEGSRSLLSGHKELVTGAESLSSGMNRYASGVEEYAAGVATFQRGMLTLANGGNDLASGMHTLKRETGGMDEKMQTQIDDVMNEFMPKDFKPVSFASKKNPEVASVQFVYMTEGLKMKKPAEEAVTVEKPKSILDKILDLFR